jgi:DNA-nicking Smr family endonuclease
MADDFMSDEDKALFREHMRTVKPLNKQTQRIKNPPSPLPTPCAGDTSQSYSKSLRQKANERQKPFAKKEYYLSDFISEEVHSYTILSYALSSIPTKRFRALKNGQIPWEGRLDLHGLKADNARTFLSDFIQTEAQNNKRCVLIIHGKGGHQGAPPVIKNLVNRWLPQLDEVLAFHSAQAKDGGQGAVYVLLKRNKERIYSPQI